MLSLLPLSLLLVGAQSASSINVPSTPPAGAVVLLSNDPASMANNFFQRYTKEPAKWTFANGAFTNNGRDITSRQEFGDCFVHIEWRTPAPGKGNAGIAMQGRYEIQMFEDFGQPKTIHNAAALYDQTPARVNASRRPGEWQTFQIFFRAPRLDANGNVTERARATVIQNGVVVQTNAEFRGPTGIQYGEFKGEAARGPIVLQGDHDKVDMRNLWVVPL